MKRRPYEDTTVSADRSKAEIREILLRYGAEQFGISEGHGHARLGFVAQGRLIRIDLGLPDRRHSAATKAGKWLRAGSAAALSIHDQEERRLWRAVRAWIYAQLESVESGIRTFSEVFLADTVLPNGERFADWAAPQIEEQVEGGRMPRLLAERPVRELRE